MQGKMTMAATCAVTNVPRIHSPNEYALGPNVLDVKFVAQSLKNDPNSMRDPGGASLSSQNTQIGFFETPKATIGKHE